MSAYLSGITATHLWITSDDSSGRRSRGAQIANERRRYERTHGVRLTADHKSYSETHGFLSRTCIRYKIS